MAVGAATQYNSNIGVAQAREMDSRDIQWWTFKWAVLA